jgi:hypothetical protein
VGGGYSTHEFSGRKLSVQEENCPLGNKNCNARKFYAALRTENVAVFYFIETGEK